MSTKSPQHRATPIQRLSPAETRFVVAVVSMTALLLFALASHLWSVLTG